METKRTATKCAACKNKNFCGNSLAAHEPLRKTDTASEVRGIESLAKMNLHDIDMLCAGKSGKTPATDYEKLARTSINEIDRLMGA